MGNRKSAYEEVISLFDQLIKVLPRFVDGKNAILEMKDGGSGKYAALSAVVVLRMKISSVLIR